MKKTYGHLLLFAGLGFAQCSSKNNDPAPVNPIAANTASVIIDGKAFPVDISRSGATVDAKTGELRVGLSTSDPLGPFVLVRVFEFRNKAEQIQFATGSSSSIIVGGGFNPGSGGDYDTNSCGTMTRAIEIVEVNQTNKTVSVRFSGNACGGQNSAQQKTVRDGQCNLPYVVK